MEEQWKDIIGYEGLYQISNFGRVKSLPRKGTKGGILKLYKNKHNYLMCDLHKDGESNPIQVHRIVALHFIPNDDLFKTDINHKDENKENNNANNLEWCDKSFNINYGTRNKRVANKLAKQVNQFSKDGIFLIKTWDSIMQIERELGFRENHICECCNGKRKTAHNYIWKYTK